MHHHNHFLSAPMHAFPRDQSRTIGNADNKVPGPAEYALSQDAAGGGAAIGAAFTVAPGDLAGRGKAGWFLGGTTMATFGKEQRAAIGEDKETESKPGPGAYRLPSTLSSAGVSAFGRESKCPVPYLTQYEATAMRELPAPGQYEPMEPCAFEQAKGALGPGISFSFPVTLNPKP